MTVINCVPAAGWVRRKSFCLSTAPETFVTPVTKLTWTFYLDCTHISLFFSTSNDISVMYPAVALSHFGNVLFQTHLPAVRIMDSGRPDSVLIQLVWRLSSGNWWQRTAIKSYRLTTQTGMLANRTTTAEPAITPEKLVYTPGSRMSITGTMKVVYFQYVMCVNMTFKAAWNIIHLALLRCLDV